MIPARGSRERRPLSTALRGALPAALVMVVALVVSACGGSTAVPVRHPGGWTRAKAANFRLGIEDELHGELKGFTATPLLKSDMTRFGDCALRAVERRYAPGAISADGASSAIASDCRRELTAYIRDAKALRRR